MKLVVCFTFFALVSLSGEFTELSSLLKSDDFETREAAEKKLVQWAREKEREQRAQTLHDWFLETRDPEEVRRLSEILLQVHFETAKEQIPQTGSGFLGIVMDRGAQAGLLGRELGQPRIQLLQGVRIESIIAGTPAQKSGLKENDLIVEIDGKILESERPDLLLQKIVGDRPPGVKIQLKITREGVLLEKELRLMNRAALPDQVGDENPKVDPEIELTLLKEDYLRWLMSKRETLQSR